MYLPVIIMCIGLNSTTPACKAFNGPLQYDIEKCQTVLDNQGVPIFTKIYPEAQVNKTMCVPIYQES